MGAGRTLANIAAVGMEKIGSRKLQKVISGKFRRTRAESDGAEGGSAGSR